MPHSDSVGNNPIDAPDQATLLSSTEQENAKLLANIQTELDTFFTLQRDRLGVIDQHTLELLTVIERLLQGGKRLRASFCYWAWKSAGSEISSTGIVQVAAALELFHAAALIHDDIIDDSDSRRGYPSAHRHFEQLHLASGFVGNPSRFGTAAAILAGDLCLSWSEELFNSAVSEAADPQKARGLFDEMRTEVMAGQYLDVLEENRVLAWKDNGPEDNPVSRTRRIITYKAAKYSVERPLLIGAALGGGSSELLKSLSAFGIPLGEAFQMRDDVLGVFGDPEVTGKPAGDDLREGKRTVLIAYALQAASPNDQKTITTFLGKPDISSSEVAALRSIIVETKALAATENLIDSLTEQALEALTRLPVDEYSRTALEQLAEATIRRTA